MFAIPLKLLSLSRTQIPKYSFSIFSKIFKTQQQQQSQSQQSSNPNPNSTSTQPPPQQPSKPKKQEQIQDYDLFTRQKQTLLNIDYTKLKQISKQIPQNLGKAGLQEVLFWADGVESPDEIFKLIDSFNQYWTSTQAIEFADNYKFRQFAQKVIKFSYLAKDFQTISRIAEFGVLYDIREQQLWNKLEQKLLSLLKNNLDLQILCQILLKFVKMRQGDMIYYKIQDLAEANLTSLSPASTAKILYSMFQRETGDIKTIKLYINHFLSKLDIATPQDIILLSTFLPYVKLENKEEILKEIEDKIMRNSILEKLDLAELAVIARNFDTDQGSDEFWKTIQSRILLKSSLTLQQSQQLIYGPLNSYRLTPSSASTIISLILPHLSSLRATHLSQLSKIIYIYQLDNQQTYQKIQSLIMQELQDLSLTPLEELMNICKNYSVTRHGSRDIYKLLEVVIRARMQEIKGNRKVFVGIYNIYSKSDLCSVEMIKEFARWR